jgi:copper chaperone CopZ
LREHYLTCPGWIRRGFNENSVAVTFDENEIQLEKLKQTIEDQGYDVKAPH